MSDLDTDLGLDTLDETIVLNGKPAARPTFLSVLCILTFVGTALGVIQGLFIWMMAGVYSNMVKGFSSAFGQGDSNTMRIVSKVFNAFSFWGVAILVGSLVCLAGALIMWRQKKVGYFIYIFGQILPIAGCYLALTSIPAKEFGGVALLYCFFFSIFPIAFIIMYGLNVKHLNK
ncbi:MAG: hypothetical protein V4638_06160 [Bacteroidota bacterium]